MASLVLEGRRLWAVQLDDTLSRWRLDGDLDHGVAAGTIKDDLFGQPVSAAKVGNHLAVVNSHIFGGYPPTSPTYEVLLVGTSGLAAVMTVLGSNAVATGPPSTRPR